MFSCIEKISCCRFPCFSQSKEEAGKNRISAVALRLIAAVGALVALAAFFTQMPLIAFGAAIVSGAAFTCHLISGSVRKKEVLGEAKLTSKSKVEKEKSSSRLLEQSKPHIVSKAVAGPSAPQQLLHPIQPFLAANVPLETLQGYLKGNFQVAKTDSATIEQLRELHESAKIGFQKIFEGDETFGTSVRYVSPSSLVPEEVDVKQASHATSGDETIYIISIPTQYNGCEKKFQKQASLGKVAVQASRNPIAEINPKLSELISAYLAHGGFNMFAPVLTEETKDCLLKGYLRISCANDVKKLLKLDWNRLELPCITSNPEQEENPIHLILGACPPVGLCFKRLPPYIEQDPNDFNLLCYQMALANYTAQLSYAFLVAKSNPEKTVKIHIIQPSSKLFGTDSQVINDALTFAAADLRKKMNEANMNNIRIHTSEA